MTKKQGNAGATESADEKAKRLQEALRANLRRRKKQDHIPSKSKKASS